MKRKLVVLFSLTVSIFLTACASGTYLPIWNIADQGETCIHGTVIDKELINNGQMFNSKDLTFLLIIRNSREEIGVIDTTPNVYYKLSIKDSVCLLP